MNSDITAIVASCQASLIAARVTRRDLTEAQRNPATWPLVDKSLIPRENVDLFTRREQAFYGYIQGEPLAELERKWSLPRSEIDRQFHRACVIHPDGRPYGLRAFIPGLHVVGYTRLIGDSPLRTTHGGHGGLMTRLLRLHPRVKQKVDDAYLKRMKGAKPSRLPIGPILQIFIQACREDGVAPTEYPFTVRNLGKRALADYLKTVFRDNVAAATRARFGKAAAQTLNTASENRLPLMVWMPLQRVGFDGHRIDAVFLVKIPHRCGGFVEVVIERPWLLVIIDIATRAVLGWHLALNSEYKREDVLKCVRSAVEPSEKPVLTIPNLTFNANGGMPNWVIPELLWALWAELIYDNGRANVAEWTRHQMISVLGSAVHPGPVATPEHNTITEALFKTLEAHSTRLMPNTTGSSPQDPLQNEPEKAARRYGLMLSHLRELLTVVIANYNGRAHESLGYRSPLEQMTFLLSQEGVVIRHLRPEKRANLRLLSLKVWVTVRGNPKKGRRLYVQFERARYTSDALNDMPELWKKRIQIVVDTEDLVTVLALLPNGAELGTLRALGGWGDMKHSLDTRRATNRLYVKAIEDEANNPQPVLSLLKGLRDRAPKNRKAASKFAKVLEDSGLPADFDPAVYSQPGSEDASPPISVPKKQRDLRVAVY